MPSTATAISHSHICASCCGWPGIIHNARTHGRCDAVDMVATYGLLFDPDEAVLLLVAVLPLISVLVHHGPRCCRWLELEAHAADIEQAGGYPAGSKVDQEALQSTWLPSSLKPAAQALHRLSLALGIGKAHHNLQLRNQELEAALSAVRNQTRWANVKMQSQLALRQKDRKQHEQALLTAVRTLRDAATNDRGALHSIARR